MAKDFILFNDDIRTFTSYKAEGVSAYDFMNISAWRIVGLMRGHYNEWVADFKNDKEFISRFRSKNDKQHDSACFELLLYQFMKNSNFTVEKHPDTGVTRKVDYLVKNNLNIPIFIECTLASDSFMGEKEKNRRKKVIQLIDEIQNYPYIINVAFISSSEVSISKNAFLKFLRKIRLEIEEVPNEELFSHRHYFEDSGWKIEIFLIRKSSLKKRSLGSIRHGAREIDPKKTLLTALSDKKASNYGITDTPYTICVRSMDSFIDDNSYAESLFGNPFTDRIDLDLKASNGLFFARKKPINTRISAVVFFKSFETFNLDNAEVCVWHNPFAKNPIVVGLLPFEEYTFEKKGNILYQKKYYKNIDMLDTLEINKENYISWKDKSVN